MGTQSHSMSDKAMSLYNGYTMPLLGLGTWHHGDQQEMTQAIKFAVKEGFRHIDCAYVYGNEKKVGEVFSDIIGKDVDRCDMFIASKLWDTEHAADRVEDACRSSLADLSLLYFDLYIIHWPSGFVPGQGNVPQDEEGNVLFSGVSIEDTWAAMEKLVDIGLVRSLGLSNFNSKQIKTILDMARIRPAVLQVESNPRFNNEALRQFCADQSIAMVAFSPFGSPDLPWGAKLPHILADTTLNTIATRLGHSPAQVVLRWQLQRGVGVIPKSVILTELEDNLGVWGWELSKSDMELINQMETGVRKIVPIIKMADGIIQIRDEADINYPFGFVEEQG